MAFTNIEREILLVIERRKFEKYAREHIQYCNLTRAPDGQYARKSMQDCWKSWCAALAI